MGGETSPLINPALLVGAAIFLFVILLSGFIYVAFFRSNRTEDRLRRLSSGPVVPNAPSVRRGKPKKGPLKNFLAKLAGADEGKDVKQSPLAKQLMLAGIRNPAAVTRFGLARLVLLVCFPLVFVTLPVSAKLPPSQYYFGLILAVFLGYMGPTYMLRFRISKRQGEIRRTLPDVVDLLVVCIEAGLGLDAAIKRVGDELAMSAPILSYEFQYLSLELTAGTPRDKALTHLAERTGVDDMASLVSMINQADRFGVSIGKSMRVHSETVRVKRRQKLEEAAAKTSLKLLFPLLLFIFPAIMVVIGGPAAMKIFGLFWAK